MGKNRKRLRKGPWESEERLVRNSMREKNGA